MNTLNSLLTQPDEPPVSFSGSTTAQIPGRNRTNTTTHSLRANFRQDAGPHSRLPAPIPNDAQTAAAAASSSSSNISTNNFFYNGECRRRSDPSQTLEYGQSEVRRRSVTGAESTNLPRKKYKSSLDPRPEPDLDAVNGVVDDGVVTKIRRQTDLSNSLSSPNSRLPWQGLKCESYTHLLNQAIQAKSSLAILEAIATLTPDTLFLPDGRQQELPLHVAIRHRPHEREVCDMLLLNNLAAATARDRHMNTALHIACSVGASIDIIRNLCLVNPFAVVERNFHGLTPLDIALRRSTSSEIVTDHLTKIYLKCLLLAAHKTTITDRGLL